MVVRAQPSLALGWAKPIRRKLLAVGLTALRERVQVAVVWLWVKAGRDALTYVSEHCTQIGAVVTCIPYPTLSHSFLQLENGDPSSWQTWEEPFLAHQLNRKHSHPRESTSERIPAWAGVGVWGGQERHPIGRCIWTRSWRKRGSFLTDEFGKGIPEREETNSTEIQGCIVHSGSDKWFGGALMRHTGARVRPVWPDRPCRVLCVQCLNPNSSSFLQYVGNHWRILYFAHFLL